MIPLVAILTSGAFAAGCWCGARWSAAHRPHPVPDPAVAGLRSTRRDFDTLLQGLEGLILRFQYGADQLPTGHPARAVVEQALVEAERIVEQGRNTVGDDDAGGLNDRNLSAALSQAGAEFNRDRAVEFQLTTGGVAPSLPATLVDELYLIGREIIRGAFQHARTRVHVALTFTGASVQLRCRDDGGISDASQRLRELDHLGPRAARIGAGITAQGCLCGDTEILVTAKLTVA